MTEPDLLWQQCAINKLKRVNEGIVWAKVGEGKSRVALRLFSLLMRSRKNSSGQMLPTVCLIVCRRKSFYDWKNEIRKCGYLHWQVSEGWDISKRLPTVWLISADMLPKIYPRLLAILQIRMIIYDELYLFSNVRAARTKAAIQLSSLPAKKIGLSGTIMPAKDNTSIYGQTRTIGCSYLLASNISSYRTKYQTSCLMQFNEESPSFRQFTNKKGSQKEILQRLGNNIVLHFPKRNDRKIFQKFSTISATNEQKKLIKQLKEEYYAILQDGSELELKFAVELVSKIQQIANGYVKNKDSDFVVVKSNKQEAIEYSVSELLAAGERCVIWCAFRHDLQILSSYFKFPTLKMQGGMPFDIDAWQRGDANIVLATMGSGASINHFEQVQYAKYFSCNFRWLDLQQSKGRHDRTSSKHSFCHYEYYFVEKTLDRHAFETASSSGRTEKDFIRTEFKSWLKK